MDTLKIKAGFIRVYNVTTKGKTNWFDFAKLIIKEDARKLEHRFKSLIPIKSNQYQTPACRPLYSVLDNNKFISTFGLSMTTCDDCLGMVMEGYNESMY